MNKISYFRDLGGLKNIDGQTVKKGILFRSSNLCNINQKSIRKIKDFYGINTILDLRTDVETSHKPDKKIEGINNTFYPVLTDEQNPLINKDNRKQFLIEVSKRDGGTRKYMNEVYKTLVSDPVCLNYYSTMLKDIINNNVIGIYHCSQGKDRTGIASALILKILNVDDKTIIKDYLRWNRHAKPRNIFIRVAGPLVFLSFKTPLQLINLLKARREYIESAFNEIEEKFGTFSNFIREGLNMNDKEIMSLREKCLV